MVARLRLAALAPLAAGAIVGATASAQMPTPSAIAQVVEGEYLIQRAPDFTTLQLLDDLHRVVSPEVHVLDEIPARRLVKVIVPSVAEMGRIAMSLPTRPVDRYVDAMTRVAVSMEALPSVASLEPETLLHMTAVAPPDVTQINRSLAQTMARIGLRHPSHLSGFAPPRPIVIALIDSGVFSAHEIFSGLLLEGTDVTHRGHTAEAAVMPDGRLEEHGTATAGLIAATIRGGGSDRPALANIRILPVRASQADDLSIQTLDAIKAIDYAIAQGVRIISANWGKNGDSAQLRQAFADAAAAHIIVVTVAGNGRRKNPYGSSDSPQGYDIDSTPFYPASWTLPNVITVAASGADGSLAQFSNWGRKTVLLAAPGDGVLVPIPLPDTGGRTRSGYQSRSGTSVAAPLVAGSIALLEAANPGADTSALVSRVQQAVAAQPSLASRVASGGILSVKQLLNAPLPRTKSPAAPIPVDYVVAGKLMSRGRLLSLVKAPLPAGVLASDAPRLLGRER